MPSIPSPSELMAMLKAQGGVPTAAAVKAASSLPAVSLPKAEVKAIVETVVARHLPAAPSQREAAPIPAAAVVEVKQELKEAGKPAARRPRTARAVTAARKARPRAAAAPVKVGSSLKRPDGSHVSVLAVNEFGGKKFACYGKRVNTAKGTRVARLFCAAVKHL